VYTAPTGATDTTPCSKTQYVYDGATTKVVKMKESISAWDSDWDI